MRARSQARGPWLLEGGQDFLAECLIPAERESGQQGDRAGRFLAKTGTIWILTKTRAVLPCSGLPSLRIVSTTVLPAPGSQLCTHRASLAAHSPRSSPPAGSSTPARTLGRGGGRQGRRRKGQEIKKRGERREEEEEGGKGEERARSEEG